MNMEPVKHVNPVEPAIRRYSDLPDGEVPTTVMVIFICPTPGCGNYFAAPSFQPDDPSLDNIQHRRVEDGVMTPIRTRRECPDCYTNYNKRVPRQAFIVSAILPYSETVKTVVRQAKKRKEEVVAHGDGSGT